MSVKCLIIDDEPLAIRVLENHIQKIPWLKIIFTTTNPVEAIDQVKRRNVDLIFLDIQMPELSGLEFIESLPSHPPVIFTTAYRQFAADAYDLDGLDYLVKPIALPRFIKAVNKYVERYGDNKDLPMVNIAGSGESRSFFIRSGHEMVRVEIDKILYIESLKDYVQIFLPDKKYIYKARISNLEEELSEDQFIRIHKSYLVPVSRISAVSPTHIRLGEKEIPIGRTYKNIVLKRLGIS
ncbi:MAG: LytTR family DNA-binding domain-containing protein [Bacteroidota bacterium]|nr:LytTR family DNA-binding domain-containing protein [Bacteroidota bacterium]